MVPALRKMGGKVLALSLALLMLLVPEQAASLTPAGTVISHSFKAQFRTPSAQELGSNQSVVTIKDLTDPAIVPPRSAVTPAGQPIDFKHTVTNRGNSPDTFQLKASLLQGPLPDGDPPPKMQFFSADGKEPLPSDSTGAQVIGPVAPGASLDLVLRVTPAPESGACVDTITVTASSSQSPSRNATLRDQLVVPAPLSAPVKSVEPAGSVPPGTTLTYSIALANGGALAVSGVTVTDPLNPLLEYQEGSASFPAGLAGSASFDAGSRTLRFQIPSLPSGFSGALSFRARVRADAPGESSIPNTASLTSDPNSAPSVSNATLTTVLTGALRVTKLAGLPVAEVGDLVPYTVQVENIGTAALGQVTVTDRLPLGFRYQKGSGTLDGVRLPDPVGVGQQVVWNLGSLEPGARRLLGYRCVVSGDAPVGTSVNLAVATGTMPTGTGTASLPASAAIKVRSSILGNKAIILGRIFVDGNGNGIPDPGEPGVAGVRVYLEDGSFVMTDKEGQYSFTGISAGNHVVKIDRSTLPTRYKPVPYNTAFAGVGWSQFITVPFGGPARGDFALAELEPAAAATPPPAAPAEGTAAPAAPVPSEGISQGGVTQLRVTPERIDIPADGKTAVPFTVRLLNGEGKRVAGSRLVTVSVGKGVIVEPDQDPKLPGHQIRVTDGIGVFRVRSTTRTGQDEILVSGENGTKGRVDLYFSSELRDWIVVGLGSLTVGGRGVSDHVENIDKQDRFEEGIYHDERLAFFARGKILGKYLLTAAYDSNKEQRDGVFQVIDPEKYYPVYGDATEIGYEAQSKGKIFLKLEAGRSYLLAGDYRTDLSENEFSRYDRALNGVKVEVNTEHLSAKGFESRTQEALVKDEIPGNGTSGYFMLSKRPVFENSERVRIEVRDRYHSERVISVTDKLRYADYSIDYNAGTILFKEPVPSLDQNLNTVHIVVIYQSQASVAERYVYGGRAVLKSESGSYIGGTAVVEQGSLKDNTLYGVDAGLKIGDRMSLKGEGAVSDTFDKGRGSAYKAEFTARLFDALTSGAYYRKVDADFSNPSMSGNEVGTEKYSGRLDYRGLSDTLFFAESFVQKDELNATKQFGNQAGFIRKFSLLEGEGGFKRIEETKGGVEGDSNLLYAGVKGALTPRLDATLRRDQLLGSSSVSEYQSRTFLKLDYRLTESTRAFLTEEYQEGSPIIRQATRFGVESKLSERMRLTTGYQLSNGIAGSTEQSNIDLNTKLIEREGFSLDSRSGYQLENSMSQPRGQAILGLNSRYRVAEGVYLNSTLERVQTVEGSTGTRTAFTLAGEYLRQKDLKLTGRYEIRSGPGEDASLYAAGLAYKVNAGLTLLGKANYWDKDASAGHDRILDSYIGTSWRPLAGNPLRLLTLARYKLDDQGSVPGTGKIRSLVLSAEPTYRIVKDWSAQGKYAGKLGWLDLSGASSQSYTDLILAGLSYDLAERWELSLYLKLMNQYDTGQHSFGSVVSAGYRVYRNVVLSAGYNYARLDDRDLSGETFQGQGPFFGVKVKFDEEMFESSERRVVPLPVPQPVPPVAAQRPAVVAPPPPKPPALLVAAAKLEEPLWLSGSAELFTLLVNGERARLPSTAVTVSRERLEGSVKLKGRKLAAPLAFLTSVEKPELVHSWALNLLDSQGKVIRSMKGSGAPPRRISWSGERGAGIREGAIYQYQLQVAYLDGSRFNTGRELFGVNRREAVLLTLSGGAFQFDSAELTPEAKRLLTGAAQLLRAHPDEPAILEGHTDGIGTERYNMELSKRRCDAAADFLVGEEGIVATRLTRRWYGKSRQIADSSTTEGRRLNRRVELKGDFQDTVAVGPSDRYRTQPFVVINDRSVPVDPQGRFETSVPAQIERLKVVMGDSLGRSLAASLPLPSLTLAEPAGETLVPYGSAVGGIRVDRDGAGRCLVSGAVQPGSTLELDGKVVRLDQGGRFTMELPFNKGEQVFGMVLRNDAGCSKLINLRLLSTPQPPEQVRGNP